ncbi:hypothetical protein LAZ67_16001664 [Cordylochernes scorpioides]|uniref:Uncharacterized protein n=1 Tax=Cordylochernes scorpioides TaxID=51811 RepID=A0ABY6LBD3_9ARAC|nr:hypothetical protein LAZ67_16001664 [Cordylochernes scorpioides]
MDDLKILIINLSAEVNRLGEKMDARLLNIEQKMEVWERRMTGIETSMASCTDALATNTRLISHNTLKIRNLEERAEALERRARENNLIIYGIESAETDSRELLLQKVKKLMAEDMQITDDVVIAECHRLGRGPKAPILIEVPDHESRISLLKNSFKLRMLNIFMSRDYSPQIREQRKILIEKRKELYKKGIGSKLRDNKLLLNGINYMVVEGQSYEDKRKLTEKGLARNLPLINLNTAEYVTLCSIMEKQFEGDGEREEVSNKVAKLTRKIARIDWFNRICPKPGNGLHRMTDQYASIVGDLATSSGIVERGDKYSPMLAQGDMLEDQ